MISRDWLSNNFFSLIPKQFFSAAVPTCDYSIQVFAGDSVVRRFHNRGQTERGFLKFLLPCDIADNLGCANNLSLGHLVWVKP